MFFNFIAAQEPSFGISIDVSNYPSEKLDIYSFSIGVFSSDVKNFGLQEKEEMKDTKYFDFTNEIYSLIEDVKMKDIILCRIIDKSSSDIMNIWIRVHRDMGLYDKIKLLNFRFKKGIFFYDMLRPNSKYGDNIKGLEKKFTTRYEVDVEKHILITHQLSEKRLSRILN